MNFDPDFFELLHLSIQLPICILEKEETSFRIKYTFGQKQNLQNISYDTLAEFCRFTPSVFTQDHLCFGGFCYEKNCYIIGPGTSDDAREKMSNFLMLLYYQTTRHRIHETEIQKETDTSDITPKEYMDYDIEQDKTGNTRSGYNTERKYMNYIREGRKIPYAFGTALKASLSNKTIPIAKDSRKQFEYMAVTSIVMSARAAIIGGFTPDAAYRLSDLYLWKLEKCNSSNDMLLLILQAMNDFSAKVAEAKNAREKSSDYVEQCKTYLCRHLRQKTDIKKLAESIGLNYSYLSRLFSETTGMTLTEYSRKEKLKGAANMLRYTNYPITEIATYFCFSSSARFSEFFKLEFGMNPSQYRKIYHMHDFNPDK